MSSCDCGERVALLEARIETLRKAFALSLVGVAPATKWLDESWPKREASEETT